MEKVIIVAADENNVIGKDGEVPWHYPEDLRRFRRMTEGYPVVMGRRTYQSLPESAKPLPDRKNIVLTRSGFKAPESVVQVASLEEAWKEAAKNSEKLFIGGGESVYRQTMEEADRIELTRIHEENQGDAYFPEPGEQWREVNRVEKEELDFVTLERNGEPRSR